RCSQSPRTGNRILLVLVCSGMYARDTRGTRLPKKLAHRERVSAELRRNPLEHHPTIIKCGGAEVNRIFREKVSEMGGPDSITAAAETLVADHALLRIAKK